jgi:hypothetical protein
LHCFWFLPYYVLLFTVSWWSGWLIIAMLWFISMWSTSLFRRRWHCCFQLWWCRFHLCCWWDICINSVDIVASIADGSIVCWISAACWSGSALVFHYFILFVDVDVSVTINDEMLLQDSKILALMYFFRRVLYLFTYSSSTETCFLSRQSREKKLHSICCSVVAILNWGVIVALVKLRAYKR